MHGEYGERGEGRRRSRGVAASAAAAVLAALLAGCGAGAPPPAAGSPAAAASAVPGTPAAASADAGVQPQVWRRWGLGPLAPAPAPPADKPVKLSASGPVPVISRIPTDRKVVFITLDDGEVKDPRFIAMMQDLKVPITMFLMDDAIKDDYGYFAPLVHLGDHVQNHTLHHPPLSSVDPARQKAEICGDQQVLSSRYGAAPLLFRPPYGALNAQTRAAVGECGPRAIIMWRESMQIVNMQYQTADRALHPGDIILAHFRGPAQLKGESMTAMFAHLLQRIEAQGFAVARLEDYIQAP